MSSPCSTCGKSGEFRKGHRQCKECEKSYGRERYSLRKTDFQAYREANREHYRRKNVEICRRRKAERHLEIDRLKSVPCKDCGLLYPPYVMDFDHRDPTHKKSEINYLINKTTAPWSRILNEIAKCDIVCVCCHRMRTWNPPLKPLDVRRKLIIGLKNVPCKDCGRLLHYCQMDFDHVQSFKVDLVSNMKSRDAILREASKCEVVCANCHRMRTQFQAQGAKRNDLNEIAMTWERNIRGGVQTVVTAPASRVVIPAIRPWHKFAGKMTDREVATRFSTSPVNVCTYRKKVGIPSFRSSKQKQTPMETIND